VKTTDTLSGLQRLSGEYYRGVTAGIQLCIQQLEINSGVIAIGKRMTLKLVLPLLKAVLEHRQVLRDNHKAFIRYNTAKQGFELFIERGGQP